MVELSVEQKREIVKKWIELRDSRVAKQNRLRTLSQEYGVTQKVIEQITREFDVWTIGSGSDDKNYQKTGFKASVEIDAEAAEDQEYRRLPMGCIIPVVILVVYLTYAFWGGSPESFFTRAVGPFSCNLITDSCSVP